MNVTRTTVVLLFLILVCGAARVLSAGGGQVARMTKGELNSRMGSPDLVVVDVRGRSDWEASGTKILGAVREDPTDVAAWAPGYGKEQTIVLYCS
jgi:rhodanese-related sulfurtransferase